MRKIGSIVIIGILSMLSFNMPQVTIDFLPSHFPEPVYQFSENPLKIDKIELGRALFYDPLLSKDTTISCASCHSPYNAFAHTDHDLSHGINDQMGNRNAPALFNLAWQSTFMWDGAIHHLDVQALAPISHPKEMGGNLEKVISKLQNSPIYPVLFEAAYGDSIVTGEHALKALAQFQLSLVSANSKYDQYLHGEYAMNTQEENGYRLFQKNCNSCHTPPCFSTYDFANNGLSIDTTLNDFGRYTISRNVEDSLLFKIPSLRNLSFTFPYMHDGRFRTLNQVMEHYTNGIEHVSSVSKELKKGIVLSDNEKTDVIAFLLTLNDSEFVFNQKHQYPKEILLSTK